MDTGFRCEQGTTSPFTSGNNGRLPSVVCSQGLPQPPSQGQALLLASTPSLPRPGYRNPPDQKKSTSRSPGMTQWLRRERAIFFLFFTAYIPISPLGD